MPQSLFAPAPNFDFFVTMWQVKGPDLFGSSAAAGVASAAVSVASSFLFGGFSEVSGLESQMEIEEYREGGHNAGPRRFARFGGYPDLVFKRGVGYDTSLADWYYQAKAGAAARIRKDGLVLLLDRGGAGVTGLGIPGLDRTPIAGWYFRNALPKAVDGPQLNAKGNDIAIERLILAHEGVDRLSPGMLSGASDAFGAMGGMLGMLVGASLAGVNAGLGAAGGS